MFEDMSRLADRLSRVAPTEAEVADPDQPLPDRMRALVDELAMQQRVTAASEGRSMVIMAELCKWAEQWQHIHDPKLLDELGADDLVAAEIAPPCTSRRSPRRSGSGPRSRSAPGCPPPWRRCAAVT